MSYRSVAREMDCDEAHVRKTMKKAGIQCYKKQKSPVYTDEKILEVKRCCRWMHDRYKRKLFVLDDEKYFDLKGPCTGRYYTSDKATVSPDVRYHGKEKYEKKILVYVALSERGVSKPFFAPSGLGVTAQVYKEHCLKRCFVSFLRARHADGNYVFWPDKARKRSARLPPT